MSKPKNQPNKNRQASINKARPKSVPPIPPTRPARTPKLPTASVNEPAETYREGGGASWLGVGIVMVVLIALAVGGFFLFYHPGANSANPLVGQKNYSIGPVACKEKPKFVTDQGFSNSASFSTSQRGITGLALVEGDPTNPTKTYQAPSWSSAGALAPIEFGSGGNVFVAPAPSINVLYNPPDKQNMVYRVDALSGIMNPFVTLPAAAAPSPENPFGVLGLGYDCEKNQLYASSVSGSTRDKEVGRLYQVDASKATVTSEFDNVDPLGVAVFNGSKGKRLYYGLARLPQLWSVALDDQGKFQGPPRMDISLAGLGPRGSDKVRMIRFGLNNQMEVHGIEFSFNLIAPTEKQETIYYFKYNSDTDTWTQAPS